MSDKTPQRLLSYADTCYRAQRSLDSVDTVRIYEFANDIELLYEGPPIRGRGKFNEKVASRFQSIGTAMDRPGTRTHLALDRLAENAQTSTVGLGAIVLTDGGIEDLRTPTIDLIESSVQELRGSEILAFFLVGGVSQQWRGCWEDWMEPLGGRAIVRGLNDLDGTDTTELWRLTN